MGFYRGTKPIVTRNLVFHIDTGSKRSYIRTGTTITSITGGYNGVLEGSYTVSKEYINFSDNSTASCDFGNILNMGTHDLTVNTWINPNTDDDTGRYWFSKSRAAAQDYRIACNLTTNNRIGTFINGGGSDIAPVSISGITAGEWSMVTVIFDRSGDIQIYINGVIDGISGTTDISGFEAADFQSTNPLRIGSYSASTDTDPSISSNSKISNLTLYHGVLTSTEILQNYNALKYRFQ